MTGVEEDDGVLPEDHSSIMESLSMYAQCRFCLEDALVDSLVAPCHCTGTSKFVHEDCLRTWQHQLGGAEDERARVCQSCRVPFTLAPQVISRGTRHASMSMRGPIFENITTNPCFQRHSASFFTNTLQQRLRSGMRPGCLILRSPHAPEPLIRAEHWQNSAFLIGGVWPGLGHAGSDALVGVNLLGELLPASVSERYPELAALVAAAPPQQFWARVGGPVQRRRWLAFAVFQGTLARADLPALVRLVEPEGVQPEGAHDIGALFGEPADLLPVLQQQNSIHVLRILAFEGHAVWHSTQLLSEIMRGSWGLALATGADLLFCFETLNRHECWEQLWAEKQPIRPRSGSKNCTLS